ncbi:CAP domain-containing protein, partial [bacterium]|nr:CAP domain-containing protein [bacterium]
EQKPERTDLDRRIARLKSVSLHRDEIERDTRESPDASKPRQEDDDDGSAAGGAGGGGGRGLGGVWRAGPAAQPQLKQKPPTQDDGPPDQAVLKRVNYYRLKAGIAAVELDPDLSAGCQAHCEYLAQNAGKPQVAGLKAHEEDPSLPGATDEGARAGRHSDLAWGFSATEAVDAWVDSLYHRTPVFHPDLKKIGVGWKDDKKSGPICALDLSEHLQTKESTKTSVVAFPPVGLSDVPTSFWDFEMPDPLPSGAANPAGYVLTLAGYRDRLADCAGTLEKDGASIDCWFSSPDQPSPAGAGYHGNVICLIPKGPLAKGATYKLTWQYQSQGVKGRQVITFTTSSSDE